MPPIKRRELTELPSGLQREIRDVLGEEIGYAAIYFPKPKNHKTARYRNANNLLSKHTVNVIRKFLDEHGVFFLDCKSSYYSRRNMKIQALYNMLISDDHDEERVIRAVAESFHLSIETIEGIVEQNISHLSPCPNGKDSG